MRDEKETGSADGIRAELKPATLGKSDSRMSKRYPVALFLYVMLGVLVWFTVGDGTVVVLNHRVEMRWIPLFVIGTFVLRTVLARQADRIRRGE
jgi:hypothetical protein